MTIDPLETVIAWLKTALTSVEGRVAGKHRYGAAWTETQTGVSVYLDGGAPDLYATVATIRLEIRIYADEQPKITAVWQDLVELSRTAMRFVVETSEGNALIHYFLPQTLLSMTYESKLRKDLGIVFFESMVAEEPVT